MPMDQWVYMKSIITAITHFIYTDDCTIPFSAAEWFVPKWQSPAVFCSRSHSHSSTETPSASAGQRLDDFTDFL